MTKGRAALPPAGFPESPLSNLNPKQKCHPDRSVAKWRDLLFTIRRPIPTESATVP
jgi:hypothetical protein